MSLSEMTSADAPLLVSVNPYLCAASLLVSGVSGQLIRHWFSLWVIKAWWMANSSRSECLLTWGLTHVVWRFAWSPSCFHSAFGVKGRLEWVVLSVTALHWPCAGCLKLSTPGICEIEIKMFFKLELWDPWSVKCRCSLAIATCSPHPP